MATTSLGDILNAVAEVQQGIKGVAKAWARLPDSLTEWPAFINEPSKGTVQWPPPMSRRHVEHDVRMVLLLPAGQDSPSATNEAWPFVNLVLDAFEGAVTLGGLVTGCAIVGYDTGRLQYAGATYYALTFTLRVTTSEPITRTP